MNFWARSNRSNVLIAHSGRIEKLIGIVDHEKCNVRLKEVVIGQEIGDATFARGQRNVVGQAGLVVAQLEYSRVQELIGSTVQVKL